MRKHQRLIVIVTITMVALLCTIGGFITGVYVERLVGVPLWQSEDEWSIGIYIGESPFKFVSPVNRSDPVLRATDVTDIKASFVADPFMVKENSTWYMFFEVMDKRTNKGKIGFASSNDGLNWSYGRIVLDEPYHLSYPYVFKWKNIYYMIPESYESNSIRLYQAVNFPTQWSLVGVLLDGSYVDSSVFRYNDRWWLFTATEPGSDTLYLFYADDLMGPWTEHPGSPIIKGNAHIARPGGRVLILNDQIIRYAQDDDPTYGNQLRAFEITELTSTSYHEREGMQNPILKASGTGWNAEGMHHIDPHQVGEGKWMACVDGYRKAVVFRLRW